MQTPTGHCKEDDNLLPKIKLQNKERETEELPFQSSLGYCK